MKRFIFAFIFILSFNTICIGACLEDIRTFYAAYLTNVLHDSSNNEVLCEKYLTEELLAKVQRLINATGANPIIQAQDVNIDAIKTLDVKRLSDDWYLVSFLQNKGDSSTLTKIPLKAQNIDGNCKITYITPVWNGLKYGDELLSCGTKGANKIDQTSERLFLESFYNAYVRVYCTMSKDLNVQLSSLRLNNLSQNALGQFKHAELDNLKDGLNGYDILIDNFDFDNLWYKSVKITRLSNSHYQMTYLVGGKIYKITVSTKKRDNKYLIDSLIVSSRI